MAEEAKAKKPVAKKAAAKPEGDAPKKASAAPIPAAKESGGLLRTLGLVPWIAFGLAALAALGGIFLVRGASSGSTDGSEDVSLDEMTRSSRH